MRGKLKDSIFNALSSQSIKYIVHSLLHKLALIRSNKEEKDFKPIAFSDMSEKRHSPVTKDIKNPLTSS